MKQLYAKIIRQEGTHTDIDIFSHVPNTKREITNQEMSINRNDDGTIELTLFPMIHKAFLCLHCGKVEYHDNANGHTYPLCSECRNTQTIFETYFQLDAKQEDYEIKTEYLKKIDKDVSA